MFALPHLDVRARAGTDACNRRRVGAALVDGDLLGYAVQLDRALEETTRCGIVAIYGAGPRTVFESNAKRADEHLVLEDLRRATKVVARSLFDLLRSA